MNNNNVIKVLHVVDNTASEQHYGKDIHLIRLAKMSAGQKSIELYMVCFHEGWLVEHARKLGITVFVLKERGRFNPKFIFDLIKIINKEKVHILHMHGYKESIIGRIAGKASKSLLISTYHGWVNNNYKLRLYNFLDVSTANLDDKIITVSENIKNTLSRKRNLNGKIVKIPSGVELTAGKKNGRSFHEIAKLPNSSLPIVAVVGRLDLEKGIDIFLKAVKEIVSKGYKFSFVIVGDGPLWKELEELSVKLGVREHVTFTGFIPQAKDCMSMFDVLVVPSRTEGAPQVVLEAMAASKPIVAADVGGIKELVEHGKNGLIVQAGRFDLLAENIISLINYPGLKCEMGKESKRRVEKYFSIESISKKIFQVYIDLSRSKGLHIQ